MYKNGIKLEFIRKKVKSNRQNCHAPGPIYLLGTLSLLYNTSWFLFFWFNFPSAGADCSQLRTHKYAIGCAHRSPLPSLLLIIVRIYYGTADRTVNYYNGVFRIWRQRKS